MEQVVAVAEPESPEEPEAVEAEETPTTQPVEDITTWKNRLAGKDRALSAERQKREAAEKLASDLSRWKAEKEEADMTEVDRLKKQVADLEVARQAAEATAYRSRLERDFPLTFADLGDKTPIDDEGWLAEREARLGRAQSEPEARNDPNNPRRTPATKPDDTVSGLEERLKALGNPFA